MCVQEEWVEPMGEQLTQKANQVKAASSNKIRIFMQKDVILSRQLLILGGNGGNYFVK